MTSLVECGCRQPYIYPTGGDRVIRSVAARSLGTVRL